MYKLRELERYDMPTVNSWRNDPELIASLGAPFRYINSEVDGAWYESYMRSRGSAVRCAIVDDADAEKILGLVSLTGIDPVNRSAELHIMIGDRACRGRGMGIFAVREMCAHGFSNLNLNRIEVGLLETNAAARGLYEKAGFTLEGARRCSNYKNGSYVSSLVMGLLKDEFTGGEE